MPVNLKSPRHGASELTDERAIDDHQGVIGQYETPEFLKRVIRAGLAELEASRKLPQPTHQNTQRRLV